MATVTDPGVVKAVAIRALRIAPAFVSATGAIRPRTPAVPCARKYASVDNNDSRVSYYVSNDTANLAFQSSPISSATIDFYYAGQLIRRFSYSSNAISQPYTARPWDSTVFSAFAVSPTYYASGGSRCNLPPGVT
jgi:hypothetical protein